MSTPSIQPDEETMRRNLAITLQQQQPPQANPLEPQMAAPGPIDLPNQPKAPDMSIFPASKPPVVFGPFGQGGKGMAQRGTPEGDKQEIQRLSSTGSGVSQIPGRIESAMPNHPVLGKVLGQGAGILGRIGDAILSNLPGSLNGVGKGIESMIPGTQGYHQAQLGQATGQLNNETANTEKEAQAGEANARVPFTQANTEHLQQETEDLKNPQEKKSVPLLHETDQGLMLVNPDTREVTPLTLNGNPLMPKTGAPKSSEHITLSGPGGKPIAANYHPDTGKYSDAAGNEITNPQPYEKPNVTNLNMGNSAKLNDRQQATATAILEGRMTPPSSFALKTPYWQDVMGSVFQQDPQFSEQRAQLRKGFTVGAQSKQVNAVNTALGHAGVLGEAIDALGNGNIKVLNKIANDLGVQTGNDAATTYNTIVHRLGPEITTAYVGAGGTAGDRGTNEKDFDYSLGPKQLKSNLGVTVKLFRSMNNSLENQWNQNKSGNMPGYQEHFIMPQAQQTLQKYAPEGGNQPAQGGGMIRAIDDKGVLHEAPAGTALPKGWKAQ